MENQGNDRGGGGGQATELENVVRIPRDWFGPRDQLVPFGPGVSDGESGSAEPPRSPSPVQGGAAVDPNSFWDEASSSIQDVVDAPHGDDSDEVETVRPSTRRGRFIAGTIAATALAVACVGALGLVAPDRGSIVHSVDHAAAGSGEYASAPNMDSIDARMVERPHLRSLVSVRHPGRSAQATHHSLSLVVPTTAAPSEAVSYQEAPAVNQVATTPGESVSTHAPPAAPTPPEKSSATTASASDRSTSSASQPAHPSQTGALTCISNCG